MRSFLAFLPFLVVSVAASSSVLTPPVATVQADSDFPSSSAPYSAPSSAPSSAFAEISFNSSTTTRAPQSTMSSRGGGRMRKEKRFYFGSIIQDPEPGDTSSQPPIGGGHTTPDASQGLTPPSFPPLPSPSTTPSSESSPPSDDSPSSAPPEPTAPSSTDLETEDPTTSAFFNTKLADNRAKREKARISYTSKLGELSRLSLAAKTSTTTSEQPQWTKIRAYRDKIIGGEAFHKVRKSFHQ
ncbi:hypothetical protein JCM5350_001081 [Sporobolomyces pararoseus]